MSTVEYLPGDHPDKHVRRMAFAHLVEMVRDPGKVDVAAYAIPEDLHLLRSPASFDKQVLGLFEDQECKGDKMPAAKTHGLLQFRPHEVTVWYGYKSSYKSVFLNELFTWWACQGVRVAIGSFEMPAFKLVHLAVKQAMADAMPAPDDVLQALKRLSRAMVVYDVLGRVSSKHMLAVMNYCARELGIQHFLVDNLTTLLPVGNDHSDLHQQFTAGVLTIARSTGMHAHLVAHTAKPEKGDVSRIPTGYNIRGTGAVPDMVDNLCAVWRNTPKEDKLDDERLLPDKREELRREPDLIVQVDKQKFHDYRGALRFWIDRRTLRFMEYGNSPTEPFL